MDYEVVTLQEKIVAGLAAHTSNTDPEMGKKIDGLWQQLFSGGQEKISDRKGETVYGLYTHYENGAEGAYDAAVGCEVAHAQGLPEGVQAFVIPAGQYARFTFRGDVTEDVGGFWAEIWKMPLPRKFTCDFEEYPPCENWDMHNAEINVYIALADFCQSCGMPMTEDSLRGTEADGTKSADYCCYCYENGAFKADCTMEQMIDFCLDVEKDSGMYEDREEAKKEMMAWFPELKRWKKS